MNKAKFWDNFKRVSSESSPQQFWIDGFACCYQLLSNHRFLDTTIGHFCDMIKSELCQGTCFGSKYGSVNTIAPIECVTCGFKCLCTCDYVMHLFKKEHYEKLIEVNCFPFLRRPLFLEQCEGLPLRHPVLVHPARPASQVLKSSCLRRGYYQMQRHVPFGHCSQDQNNRSDWRKWLYVTYPRSLKHSGHFPLYYETQFA